MFLLTYNPAALHLDEEYCTSESEFDTRIIDSGFDEPHSETIR